MADIANAQSARVGGEGSFGADILKALDEYNYCASPKGECNGSRPDSQQYGTPGSLRPGRWPLRG